MTGAAVTACASIMIAVMAYWLNHRGEIRRSLKQERIDRVSRQLECLYGPLLVLAETNEKAWKEYCRNYDVPDGRTRQTGYAPLSEQDDARWRTWAEMVFAPNARKMREVITARGDLIIGEETPTVVLDFCAHAVTFDALLADWQEVGPSKSTLIRHPGDDFLRYVRESYRSLREEQAILLEAANESRQVDSGSITE
ncbi:hypothetical protein [Streptomyces albidoflavus]|uniref:hypothetical protein n=1 Tax=Streptomyces albidoflavus TaxID=1886 RepID=UPI00101E6857|nr:hypothetical protein [Streptomyces albidoflavus]